MLTAPSTTMTIGAMARIGTICEAMIQGIRLRSSAFTWTMPTAIRMPRSVPSVKPTAVDDSVTQAW
ncbi:hypothetical protein D3C71_1734430 [compost metagenome]